MAHFRSARRHAIPLFALVCAACAAVPDASPPDRDVVDQQVLEYQAECSLLKPREAILRVRWPVSATLRDTRIEVSPYKDGFRTGRFVAAPAGDPKALPESGAPLRAPEGQAVAPALPETFAVRLESLRLVKDGAMIEAVLGGLIPGVNYYVRVPGIPGPTLRVQAPICPVDYVDSPRESPQ
jgi:hypothetical protein